ncbi:cupin domain-containing protein [Paeniglutamicibacter sp. NPDC012692]|uniref:cupin domain-containing protein n=1 Tax=Paeniglutamicibacter sp. NPDC012692 TaxID=3364388 RepID=UPI00368EBB8A
MKKFSLTAIARTQMRTAATASSGRSASTVFGGHEHTLRQTVMGLAAGTELKEHINPGEATVMVLSGRIRLTSGEQQWEGRTGDLLVMPSGTSQITALEESGLLLSVAKTDRAVPPSTS